jgi:hypothetical protein
MALGFPKPIKRTDPRLQGHETDYTGSQGGWVKRPPQPVPGTPKKPKK